MVRSLAHWTKTLSFPARISPNKSTKDSVINIHHQNQQSPTITPTPSNNSLSNIPNCVKNNEINSMMNGGAQTLNDVAQVSYDFDLIHLGLHTISRKWFRSRFIQY